MEIETQAPIKTKINAQDFFLHIGSMITLYTLAVNLVNLLFTVINKAYPQINSGYSYFSSDNSISFPVATIITLFPVFILLMWLLEKSYVVNPEKKYLGLKKWLTYITLFVSGVIVVGDLGTLLYYFIDGQELTTGFILKILSILAIALGVFTYYISDVRDKLTHTSRVVWRLVALLVVVSAIVLGFSIIGSPFNQRLLKYDEQKVSDLQSIDNQIRRYVFDNKSLPEKLSDINYTPPVDKQNSKPYEYKKNNEDSYELCAEFNKMSETKPGQTSDWNHKEGWYCLKKIINLSEPYDNGYYNSRYN